MYILINDKPVNILNISNISEVKPVTFGEIFINPWWNPDCLENIGKYNGKVRAMEDGFNIKYHDKVCHRYLNNEFDENEIIGYCFIIEFKEDTRILSNLYEDKHIAQEVLDELLKNIKDIFGSLHKNYI